MNTTQCGRVDSNTLDEFARLMNCGGPSRVSKEDRGARINLDRESVKNGLGQLVLTVVKLLHELLERQAVRRMESGSLTDEQIERLGVTLLRQAQEIERLRKEFGLEEEDLNLDLGPLGKLL
ncbi:MAG: gas vesicle protein K [Desulfomonilaceae bacterium]|nr:gas vesicle protein K [Desulfomonilaceae bacterium]